MAIEEKLTPCDTAILLLQGYPEVLRVGGKLLSRYESILIQYLDYCHSLDVQCFQDNFNPLNAGRHFPLPTGQIHPEIRDVLTHKYHKLYNKVNGYGGQQNG